MKRESSRKGQRKNRNGLRQNPKSRLPQPAHRLLDGVQVDSETPSNGGERLTRAAEFGSLGSNHLIHRHIERVADLEITRDAPAGSESFRPRPIPYPPLKKGVITLKRAQSERAPRYRGSEDEPWQRAERATDSMMNEESTDYTMSGRGRNLVRLLKHKQILMDLVNSEHAWEAQRA